MGMLNVINSRHRPTLDVVDEWALEKYESRLRRDTSGFFPFLFFLFLFFTDSTSWQNPEIKGLL